MSYRNSTAERTTITRNVNQLDDVTGNIFETVAILSKRSRQISVEMKEELMNKLAEFATSHDNLEEVFENREQIEISRFYERLPKPTAIALQELLAGDVYYRHPEKEESTDEPIEKA